MEYLIFLLAMVIGALVTHVVLTKKQKEILSKVEVKFNNQINDIAQALVVASNAIEAVTLNSNSNTSENLKLISDTLEDSANNADSTSQQLESIISSTSRLSEMLAQISDTSSVTTQSAMTGIEEIKVLNQQLDELNESKPQLQLILSKFDEINEKTSAIRYVGEEAEMLALNAAIEAARAGDAGRGFAVVADNMKELAKKSQESTTEILAIVQESGAIIQNITVDFESKSNSLVGSVEMLNDNFGQIESAIRNIETTSNELNLDSSNQLSLAESVSNSVKTSVESLVQRLSKLVSMITGQEVIDLSPENAKQKWATFDEIIDVRRENEWSDELGHIAGITLCTLQTDFKKYVTQLDPNKTYLFICRSGGRSAKAAQMAMAHGVANVFNLEGGMLAWRDKGL